MKGRFNMKGACKGWINIILEFSIVIMTGIINEYII